MSEQRSLYIFRHSIKSEVSKKVYLQNLEYFRRFCKLKDFDSILKIESKQLDGMSQDYIISLKSKISPNSIPSLTSFYQFAGVNYRIKTRQFMSQIPKSNIG